MKQVLPFTFALMILDAGSYNADNETASQEQYINDYHYYYKREHYRPLLGKKLIERIY